MQNYKTSNSLFKKKLFIKSYGCQMNVYDSERIRNLFEIKGFEETLNFRGIKIKFVERA